MTAVIIIIIIAVILYFLFWNKKTDDKTIAVSEDDKNKSQINHVEAEELTEQEICSDENGQDKIVEKIRQGKQWLITVEYNRRRGLSATALSFGTKLISSTNAQFANVAPLLAILC